MGAELDSCSAGQQPGAAQVGSVKCFALIFPALGPGPGRGGCGVAPGVEYWLLPATWRLSQQVVVGAGLDRYLHYLHILKVEKSDHRCQFNYEKHYNVTCVS